MMAVDFVVRGASTFGGAVLGAAARTAGALRPAAKPGPDPKGRVLVGRLRRLGLTPSTGIRFLDEIADEEVIVRESRAVGLPRPLPDIHGLAIRVPLPDQAFGDLLLASTGYGRLSRYVLTPSRETYGRPMTTLLPYRTDAGSGAARSPLRESRCGHVGMLGEGRVVAAIRRAHDLDL